MSVEEIMLREALILEGVSPANIRVFDDVLKDVVHVMLNEWEGDIVSVSGDQIRTDVVTLAKQLKAMKPPEKTQSP